jgi:16S rRNA (uracil1498-N3)-methyltransferase
MSAPQFFADPADLGGEEAVLHGDEARHAAQVLRLKAGERLLVADGRGRLAEATAVAVSRDEVRARVTAVRTVPPRRPALTVVVGLVKGGKLDLVVQKLTELGVERVAPALCRRSVVAWDDAKRAAARERWTAIALAAAKQSRRALVPEIAPVAALADQVAAAPAPRLVCWEEGGKPLSAALPADPPAALTLVVGPEGGLEAAEVAACQAAGAEPVSLGPLVLRAETAAIATAAAAAFRYGHLG